MGWSGQLEGGGTAGVQGGFSHSKLEQPFSPLLWAVFSSSRRWASWQLKGSWTGGIECAISPSSLFEQPIPFLLVPWRLGSGNLGGGLRGIFGRVILCSHGVRVGFSLRGQHSRGGGELHSLSAFVGVWTERDSHQLRQLEASVDEQGVFVPWELVAVEAVQDPRLQPP